MLINCWPARPADTELEVAMTVVRLIAAATVKGNSDDEIEERDQEHAAAEPKQRAEAAGHRARDEDDQRQCGRDDGHRRVRSLKSG